MVESGSGACPLGWKADVSPDTVCATNHLQEAAEVVVSKLGERKLAWLSGLAMVWAMLVIAYGSSALPFLTDSVMMLAFAALALSVLVVLLVRRP